MWAHTFYNGTNFPTGYLQGVNHNVSANAFTIL